MKAIVTKEKKYIDITDEITRFAFKVGIVLCVLIGVWAVSCFVAGLVSKGSVEMVRGYIGAITGW
jgi:hypothetical protein